MNKYRINAWVKRAIRKQLGANGKGGLNQYQPALSENLATEYGMDSAMRAGSAAFINDEFKNSGEEIPIPLLGHETRTQTTARGMASIVKARFGLTVFLGFFAMLSAGADAFASFHIQDFDTDGNPELVSYEELRLYLIYNQSLGIAKFDVRGNRNGILDGEEVSAYNQELAASVDEVLAEFFYDDRQEQILTNGPPVPIDSVLDNFNLERKVEPKPLTPKEIEDKEEARLRAEKQRFTRTNTGFYLRNEGRNVSIRAGSLSSKPATIGFSRDNLNETSVGRISGAVGYLFSGQLKPKALGDRRGPVLDEYAFGGSIEMNRTFDSRGRDFEIDSLTLRLGGDLQFSGISAANIPSQFLSGWVKVDTDSRLDSLVLGVESIYEPYLGFFGRTRPLQGNLKLNTRFTPTLRSDYSFVREDPNNRYVVDEYWNLGFGAAFKAGLTDNDKKIVEFTSEYEHYWDVLGGLDHSYSWQNALSFPLISQDEGEVALTVSHSLSKESATASETSTFQLDIGAKF